MAEDDAAGYDRERDLEERAAFESERFAAIDEHITAALAAAAELWPFDGGSYAYTYLLGEVGRREREFFAARPVQPPTYTKRPIPASFRTRVFERDGYRCVQCGDWHDLRVDHVVPEVMGGELTMENCQTLCQSCNSRKGARV